MTRLESSAAFWLRASSCARAATIPRRFGELRHASAGGFTCLRLGRRSTSLRVRTLEAPVKTAAKYLVFPALSLSFSLLAGCGGESPPPLTAPPPAPASAVPPAPPAPVASVAPAP